MKTRIYKNFLIKGGTKDDRIQIIQLFNSMPPWGFISTCSRRFQRNFINYLLENPLGTIMIAIDLDSTASVGYAIAIRNSFKFWIGFILKYFISSGFEIFLRKYKTLIRLLMRKPNSAQRQMRDRNLPEFAWSSSNQEFIRIIFIGVCPNFRGLGLGEAIYSFLAEILKKEGCIKIEAHIDKGNDASVCLHRKSGWQIQQLRHGDYKAVLDLDKTQL